MIAAVMTVRKPIPNSITNAATSRPADDSGTLSPYPTVVVVWIAHQSPDPIDGYLSWSVMVIKTPAATVTTNEVVAITTAAPRGVVARATAASSRRSSLDSAGKCGGSALGHVTCLSVAHSNVWIAKATANPRVVTIPASLPPCSNASGIIVSASMVRIAPAAKASTKATVSGEESWKRA